MYRIKWRRLRELIDERGNYGLAAVSQGAQISVSTLEKMYAGQYKASPRDLLRERLCRFLKVNEADLFERVGAGSKGRAS